MIRIISLRIAKESMRWLQKRDRVRCPPDDAVLLKVGKRAVEGFMSYPEIKGEFL